MKKTAPKKLSKDVLHSADEIRKRLKVRKLYGEKELADNEPYAFRKLAQKGILPNNLRKHSSNLLGTGIMAGVLLLSPPKLTQALPSPDDVIKNIHEKQTIDKSSEQLNINLLLSNNLKSILPESIRPLHREEEKLLELVLSQTTGVKVKATLEGEHLNTTYGRIGIEQHLRRYPGDTLSEHGTIDEQREGMAPGLGAWGYFAPSKSELTDDLIETEKWYAVVQTLYLPDWDTRQPFLKNWYKYRKLLIVNTENGNAVVASIADSGPAAWTGKHYGGSPEVMRHLGGTSERRYTKGPVLVFFVDDPHNKVPLGPVNYDTVNLSNFSLE